MYQCASAQSTALTATCLKVIVEGAARPSIEGAIEDDADARSRHCSLLEEGTSNRMGADRLRKTPFSFALTKNL
jgi:hypothetical protein